MPLTMWTVDTLEPLDLVVDREAVVAPPALRQERGEVDGLLCVGGGKAQHYLQGALSRLL